MAMLMTAVPVPLAQIYVPARMRAVLDAQKVEALALSISEKGLQIPIQVRKDKERYVLVAGMHRLEAVRSLGETTIKTLIVQARLR